MRGCVVELERLALEIHSQVNATFSLKSSRILKQGDMPTTFKYDTGIGPGTETRAIARRYSQLQDKNLPFRLQTPKTGSDRFVDYLFLEPVLHPFDL